MLIRMSSKYIICHYWYSLRKGFTWLLTWLLLFKCTWCSLLYYCCITFVKRNNWSHIYIYIYIYKLHRSKISIIYMLSWKQCALPVITAMALWKLMHLGTRCIYMYMYIFKKSDISVKEIFIFLSFSLIIWTINNENSE